MANIIRFDPFTELQALQRQFLGDDWPSNLTNNLQLPTTDVYMEGDNQMVVEAHLPDFDEEDIIVDIDDGVLEIQAEMRDREEDQRRDRRYVVRESSSSFYRRVRLPEEADTSNIEAQMDDGILRITIPLKKLRTPKKVTISPGNSRRSTSRSTPRRAQTSQTSQTDSATSQDRDDKKKS